MNDRRPTHFAPNAQHIDELADYAILRNRSNMPALHVDGWLVLEDGRAFELAGREAAWTVDADADYADIPTFMVLVNQIEERREEVRAAEQARLDANRARDAAADAARAAREAARRAHYDAWAASPAGRAAIERDAADMRALLSALLGRVFR